MISKSILINDLERLEAELHAKYHENDEDPFYGGSCSALQEVIKLVNAQQERYEWETANIVPVAAGYILLSFENLPVPLIGRYQEDENGGAYYIGDQEYSCISQGFIVNGWMPLPEPYRPE